MAKIATTDPASETLEVGSSASGAACPCDFGGAWHDRLLGLEHNLPMVLEALDEICDDFESDFVSAEDIMRFVAQHEWEDRVTVTRFANTVETLAEYVHNLRKQVGFFDRVAS